MKRFFAALAVVMCLVAIVSCGKKEDPIKAKVEAFYKEAMKAEEKDDYAALLKLDEEMGTYYNTLSDEEKAAFEKYMFEIVEAEFASDDVEEAIDDVYEHAAEIAEDTYEYADDVTEDAYEYAENVAEDAYEYAEKMVEDAERMAEDMLDSALDGFDW